MNPFLRDTRVEINLDNLEHNLNTLRAWVGRGVALAPVLKADAYGHGAVTIARELSRLGVEYLAVAILSEALELRAHGIAHPILIMGYTPNEHLPSVVEHGITATIFDEVQAGLLSNEALCRGTRARVHIKVDTGLHRLGKLPSEDYAAEITRMAALPGLELEGLFTHLRLANREGDLLQYEQFDEFVRRLASAGIRFRYTHASDSIAAVKYPEHALDMVRPGAIVYGCLPKYQAGQVDVRPIMTFKTRVSCLHDVKAGDGVGYDEDFQAPAEMRVATLPVGYADGYTRALSRVGEVSIHGRRAKVIGIVCMDQMMVDVSAIDHVRVGDEAILFGPGPGEPSIEEVATWAKTNKNHMMSGISRRVPRVYFKNGHPCAVVDYLAGIQGELNES